MPNSYYFGKKPDPEKKILRRVLIILGIAILLASGFIFNYIYQHNTQLEFTRTEFINKLNALDYNGALSMYRDIQETVINQPADRESTEKEILRSMENVVAEKTTDILEKTRYDRYSLDAADRNFLAQMGEVSGAVVSNWLGDLCEEFLMGTIERPTLQFVFDQISPLSNITYSAAPLQASMDTIETVSGAVQAAEKMAAEKSYIGAVKGYQDILDTYSDDEFVSSFCREKIAVIKKDMYDPLISQCRDMMKNFRYYSAENILSDLSQIFPGDSAIEELLLLTTENTSRVVEYTDDVEVLSVRPLLADRELAFSDPNYPHVEANYLSTYEFAAMLQELYDNDYILLDPRAMTDQSNPNVVTRAPLRLPEGKKPVVIVVENVNYSPRASGLGFCRRLVLNDQNQICGEYINSKGETIVDRQAEAIGILDQFVEEHPDFSFDGAKGIVSFSGFEVIMGYVTHEDQIYEYNLSAKESGALEILPTRTEMQKNAETVISIVEEMRSSGWVMASSTYQYISARNWTMQDTVYDTDKWLAEIGSLTGEADVLVYPFGEYIDGTDPRCEYMKENGFRIFLGISPTAYKHYGDNYLYLDRALMSGLSFRENDYSRLFDVEKIYDPMRKTALQP